MSAGVGRSGSEGKPDPQILHAAQKRWSCWRSAQVSGDFNLRFRLFPRA